LTFAWVFKFEKTDLNETDPTANSKIWHIIDACTAMFSQRRDNGKRVEYVHETVNLSDPLKEKRNAENERHESEG
jgi:hypothetical protein